MHKRLMFMGMGGVIGTLWLAFSAVSVFDDTPVNQVPAKLVSNLHSRNASVQTLPTLKNSPIVYKTGLENLPASIQTSPLKGALEVDATGHLVVNANVRHVFDFFLYALEDAPFEQTVARMRAYIASKLPDVAAAEANQVLEAYLALKQAVDVSHYFSANAVQDDQLTVEDLMVRRKQLMTLRQNYLGEHLSNTFFADDNAFDDFFILRRQILLEQNTAALEKAERIAALERNLPNDRRFAYKEAVRQRDVNLLTQEWVNQGGSAEALRQIRINLLGRDVAANLDAQDKANAQWDIRVANWLEQRNKLLHDQSTADAEKNSKLDFMRSNYFTFEELPRVKAEEHLRDYAFAK